MSTSELNKLKPTPNARLLQQWFMLFVCAAITLVVLVQGRFFLIPLAIAVLAFALLSAGIDWLARQRAGPVAMPYWLANVIGLLVLIAGLMVVFLVVSAQIEAVVVAAPRYADRVQMLIADLFLRLDEDVGAGVRAALAEVDVAAAARTLAGSVGYMLGTILLIVLYVGFLFVERANYPHKLRRMFPNPRRSREVERIVQSINRSVRRYVLVKAIVSALTGVLVYLVLRIFDLDLAETWALLAVFLNFIPNIGSIVATVLPTVAALVQYETWTPVTAILISIGAIQLTIGNVIEPTLMGRTLNLSSFVIILSLTFWAAIWGVIGMFLAVPITVMLMIVCSHVPMLRPIAVLLSADGHPPGKAKDITSDAPEAAASASGARGDSSPEETLHRERADDAAIKPEDATRA